MGDGVLLNWSDISHIINIPFTLYFFIYIKLLSLENVIVALL